MGYRPSGARQLAILKLMIAVRSKTLPVAIVMLTASADLAGDIRNDIEHDCLD